MNIQIHKFGGAVLGKKEGILSLQNLILNDINPKVIVVSALENTTRLLKAISFAAEKNEIQKAESLLSNLIEKHLGKIDLYEIAQKDIAKNEIEEIGLHLSNLIKGIAFTNQLTERTLDLMMSFGEKLAMTLLKFLFDRNDKIEFMDSTEFIRTNSHYGNATPDRDLSKSLVQQNLVPRFNSQHTIITQGFVGMDMQNEITTMGLESSNLTATLLADFLKCKDLIIWTDVDGIKNADPKSFKNVKNIDTLDYESAEIASFSGLKLIYPTMIEIAKKKGIEIIFKSALSDNTNQTKIGSYSIKHQPILILDEGLIESTEHKSHFDKIKFNTKDFVIVRLLANEIKLYQKNNNKILRDNQRTVNILSILSINGLEKEIFNIIIQHNLEIIDYSGNNLKLILNDNQSLINDLFDIINKNG